MTPQLLLATVAAGGYLAMPLWARHAAAAGVPIPVHITDAHRVAMAELEGKLGVFGAAASTQLARDSAFNRLLDVRAQLLKTHQGEAGGLSGMLSGLAGGTTLPVLSKLEQFALVTAFMDAAAAGVRAGYPLFAGEKDGFVRNGPYGNNIPDAVEDVLRGEALDGLSPLGEDLRAAALLRGRIAVEAVPGREWNGVLVRLSASMDDVGYLITGVPPPEKTLAGSFAWAWDTAPERIAGWGSSAASAVAGLAGDALGSLGGALLGSPLLWAGVLGFVAWKVLR